MMLLLAAWLFVGKVVSIMSKVPTQSSATKDFAGLESFGNATAHQVMMMLTVFHVYSLEASLGICRHCQRSRPLKFISGFGCQV
jgi:hypothetical protein